MEGDKHIMKRQCRVLLHIGSFSAHNGIFLGVQFILTDITIILDTKLNDTTGKIIKTQSS